VKDKENVNVNADTAIKMDIKKEEKIKIVD